MAAPLDPDRWDDALMRCLIRVYAQPDRWVMGGTHIPRDTLTDNELRTLEAVSRGVGYEGAAELLGVGLETVKDRLRLARRVLRAKNTTHACCEALRRGLIR